FLPVYHAGATRSPIVGSPVSMVGARRGLTSISRAMENDKLLRKHLIKLLEGGDAHATFDDAVAGVPAALQGKTPKGAEHSPWQLLEHLRIAQWDILEFAINTKHKSPKWPEGYWPKIAEPPDEKAWQKS